MGKGAARQYLLVFHTFEQLPICLDADVQSCLAERAAQKGIPLNEMINGLLKRDIRIIESGK